jgi:hypothetical protein
LSIDDTLGAREGVDGGRGRDSARESTSSGFTWVEVVERAHAEQGEPEVGDAPEEPLQLGLVPDGPDQPGVTVGASKHHAREGGFELISELAVDHQPIGSFSHTRSMSFAPSGTRDVARFT